MLTSKERAELRSQATAIDTTLMVGKSGITDALIVPVSLPQCALIFHAAFFHHIAGMGIVSVVHGLHTVISHRIEQKINHGL